MARIIRWNPNRPSAFDYMFDRMLDEGWRNYFTEDEDAVDSYRLALDVTELDRSYLVTADLAGVETDDIDVRIEDDVLTIEANVLRPNIEHENSRHLLSERRYGKFSRSVRLPQPVDADNIEATYHNGVLELDLPKTPEAQPKQIAVKAASKKK